MSRISTTSECFKQEKCFITSKPELPICHLQAWISYTHFKNTCNFTRKEVAAEIFVFLFFVCLLAFFSIHRDPDDLVEHSVLEIRHSMSLASLQAKGAMSTSFHTRPYALRAKWI